MLDASPEVQFVPSLVKIFPVVPGNGNCEPTTPGRVAAINKLVAESAWPAKTEGVAEVVAKDPLGCT